MVEAACTNETCTGLAVILHPVPLCAACSIETALAILPLALANALGQAREIETEAIPETESITPTKLERAAITALRGTNTPITRRTVGQAIRSLGGTCATDRANALAAWAKQGGDLGIFNELPADQ